ncbi:MAG: N-acetylglucosamine-6-phosphate deacetylase [Patescibacteria group bacterium]
MKAYHGRRILTAQGPLAEAYLIEEDGVIAGIAETPGKAVPVVTYAGCTLAPGLIDVHTHGALGCEAGYCGRDDLRRWAAFELAHGVTGFLPSTASIPTQRIERAAADVGALAAEPLTNILGLHMEGPFYMPGPKIGAQNPQYIRQDFGPGDREFLRNNPGVIRYIAVDPALPAAEEIVPFCAGLGIRVSAAHSSILYEDFRPKKAWGYTGITHAFNGMVGLDHRHPGLAYAACMDRDLYTELICDGHHVNYLMAKLLLQLRGYEKTILITDSLSAAGMPPGTYALGDLRVDVTADGRITKWDGGLAGSTLTLDRAVRNVVRHLGLPLHEAVYMASTAPAEMLGMGRKGRLGPGLDADFIVLDEELNVVATYLRGRKVFGA